MNKLQQGIINDWEDEVKKMKETSQNITQYTIERFVNENMDILTGYAYLTGRISILKSMINSLIEKLIDFEEESRLTEKDTKIIEESKKDEKLNYFG